MSEMNRNDPSKKPTESTGHENEKVPDGETVALLATECTDDPSMTLSLFLYWVLPFLMLAILGRYGSDTTIPSIDIDPNLSKPASFPPRNPKESPPMPTPRTGLPKDAATPSPHPDNNWPTAYNEVISTIEERRRPIYKSRHVKASSKKSSSNKNKASTEQQPRQQQSSRATANDPQRRRISEKIEELREEHLNDPNDIFKALNYADMMRLYDLQFHEGGLYEQETLRLFAVVAEMARARRQSAMDRGEPTNVSELGTVAVSNEVTLDYKAKSEDGILCAVYVAYGKALFMANMFERAVEEYSKCLEIDPFYLDARNSRGSCFVILGKYEEAGTDFMEVIQRDVPRLFVDSFTGLVRVLGAKEEAVPDGWKFMHDLLERLIPQYEMQLKAHPKARNILSSSLIHFHHTMFSYHDAKTGNRREGFAHLKKAYQYKMSMLPTWTLGSEMKKINQTKKIFHEGFWPGTTGSQTEVPIFIIGFVRSGSTLLERVLDAHPAIVGTGENSVFNGRLDDIRNQIVQVSMSGQMDRLSEVTRDLADGVVTEMRRRWQAIQENTEGSLDEEPKRFADKMLTNYHNVGFIHMLYPNALILHVAREPMDCLFSSYKHEFPAGTLDYTSEFESLSELYGAYREIIEHWDAVLPGRIKHIRYEDMVNDMPGVARAVIAATGLPWDESVLAFHKKKHAVNTWSSTQVRKGVYKDGMKSWMKYEEDLQPLLKLVGKNADYELKTTLPGYVGVVAS